MTTSPRRPSRLAVVSAAGTLAVLAACAAAPVGPKVAVPESLRAPAGETLVRTLDADGVQIYKCQPKAADASAAEWAFVAPEAKLFDAGGTQVGKHFAGPSWEATDGSKVVGSVRAKLDAPDAGAIQWLQLATHSAGPDGAFAKVTTVQRVATVGGVAPAEGCGPATIGAIARVPYKAQYVFYAKAG